MAQLSIDNIPPEVAQAYLEIGAEKQQHIKEILEMLILQQAQSVKSLQSKPLIQAIKNFRVNKAITRIEIKDLIEEGRE